MRQLGREDKPMTFIYTRLKSPKFGSQLIPTHKNKPKKVWLEKNMFGPTYSKATQTPSDIIDLTGPESDDEPKEPKKQKVDDKPKPPTVKYTRRYF